MAYEQTAGARYGIWGVDPYGPTIKQTPLIPNIVNTGLKTAEGVSNLFAKRYENQQQEAKARLAQETVGSEIAAKNAMNQANQQYYPLQQAAKLQQEQATIKEIMGRTGVSYAQAQHLAAQTGLVNTQERNTRNPFSQTQEMIKTFETLPDGSREKIALGTMLDNTFAGGAFPKPKNTRQGNATMTGVTPGLGAPWQRDPRFGSTRGGAGGTYQDASGQRVSTNTNANTTQDQKTIGAIERVDPLINEIADKQGQFATLGGKAGLTKARIENLFGANNQSPSDYATVQSDTELSAESLLKAFGLNTTDQSANMMKAAIRMLPGESKQAYKARIYAVANTLRKNQREAQQRLNSGIPVGQGEPASQGYFSRLAIGENPDEPQAQQQQPQMDLSAMAQEAIARGADPEAVRARMAEMQGGG
jgi:hypothetical protein